MKDILKAFHKKLTNLTSNNKSLSHLRLVKSQDIDFKELDFLLKLSSHQILEKVISRRISDICQYTDSRDGQSNEISRQLGLIHRTAKFITAERGSKDLYVGWPFVHGKLGDDTYVRAPLLFFPIELNLVNTTWKLSPRKEEPISFNKSFLLAYAHYNKIPLDDDFIETEFDEYSNDAQEFKNELYEFLKLSPLELNFNTELFSEQIIKFTSFKKLGFIHQAPLGELKLEHEAVLGIYPQSGSFIAPDYEQMIDKDQFESLEEFFVEKTPSAKSDQSEKFNFSYQFINEIKEEQLLTPFKLDASQENAIKAIKKGHSIVVQGPPGSGKSQLISNIVADFTARGKNVLIVCQKRAALDVVYNRLEEKGIGEFAGLIHDFKNDRKVLYDKINHQIERIEEYEHTNNSLDAIELERNFIQSCRKIDQITEELDEYKWALFNDSEFGKPIKSLYLESDPKKPFIDFTQEYKGITQENIQKTLNTFKHFLPLHHRFHESPHPLKERKTFAHLSITDLPKFQKVVKDVADTTDDINRRSQNDFGSVFNYDEYEWLETKRDTIKEFLELIKPKKIFKHFQFLLDKETDKDWFLLKENRILSSFKNEGMERSLDKEDLGIFQEILEQYIKAKKSFFKRAVFLVSKSKFRYQIKRVLIENKLKNQTKDLKKLQKMLDNRMNYEHNITSLREKEWVEKVPEGYNFEKLQKWFHHVSVALEAQELIKDLRSINKFVPFDQLSHDQIESRLSLLLDLSKDLMNKKIIWQQYLTAIQIRRIGEDKGFYENLLSSLQKDFDAICEYDKLLHSLSPEEKSIIQKISDELDLDDWHTVEAVLKNSLYIAWINHIETKYPILKIPSHGKIDQMEQELRKSVKDKLELSKSIASIRLRERIYKNVEYNRLNNRITYRELQHQATKKRKIWPLRKVIENFNREVFDLIPCWLASPETVSAIFPLDTLFDLIIFDEASQCFSEKGLPSIFRAKQVMITGDDQQLSPFDLYQIRYETASDDLPIETEKESLLDLGKLYLIQLQLKGHYRSNSLDLIDFSNQHFYNGKLELIQGFRESIDYKPAIEYKKVDGIWSNNQNIIEASAVVDQVKDLIKKEIEDIGIITFNFKQQRLISELLEEEAIKNDLLIPSRLFIKNIENVQGDERDHIIFSLAYAPDEAGKLRLHFGSLNSEKGENRLNVAITRAKQHITLVTSLHPSQLDVDHLKNRGPKLLKEYITYAKKVSDHQWKPTSPAIKTTFKSWLKHRVGEVNEKYDFKEYYPFADLSVYQGDKLKGVVLTDDDQYFQSTTTKEKHAYLPLFLNRKNWKYTKLHSRNYWIDKEEVASKIERAFYED